MSKIPHQTFDCSEGCSVEAALSVIGGKWKGTILYRLFSDEVLRFNEIRRILPELSQRTLTAQLRALEKDGIICRTIYPEVPPRVEYRLTAYGETLRPVIMALKNWGDVHKARMAPTSTNESLQSE
ncbi:MAG: helix-turn-helix domain-containing protein [Neisseria sp.]|uniref:winged helix-turn-helix transcriptional regulator n=1 Tax=Neisseria sp. TaxID=192066 RepID=UPI0026DAB7AC|nr:helix-turn-helix domain-containing protein [Neisseria sp.]MDO4641253.1 helix-turn-helix domain-containing protein [Neisseria sp.]